MKNSTLLPRLIGLWFLLGLALSLEAQVVYDNNAQCDAPNGTGTSSTIASFTVPAKNNELLVVLARGSSNVLVSTLTFNGQSLTRFGSAISNGGARAETWYLVLGNVTTPITGSIVATWPSGILYRGITAASFKNVAQATPLSNLSSSTFNTTATATSLSIAGSSGDMVMEAISSIGLNSSTPPTFTPTSSQTELATCNSLPSNSFRQSAACTAQTGGTTTLGWNIANISSSTNNGIQMAVNIKALSALPISLVHFEVLSEAGANMLRWETANERNSHHFEVQHSTNGWTFSPLGEVAAAGESERPERYLFRHDQPAPGTHYYRLKSMDKDGSAELSTIISIVNGRDIGNITIYPNPAQESLNLQTADREQTTRLYDLQGRLLYESASVPERIDLTGRPAGCYTLQIGAATMKMVKE